MKFDFDNLQEDESPYPEVQASVSNTDDPDMPVLTFRMWVVGLLLSLVGRYVHPYSLSFPLVSHFFFVLLRDSVP